MFWIFKYFFYSSVSFSVAILALLYVYQTKLIYLPDLPVRRFAMKKPNDFSEIKLQTKDGVKIQAFYLKNNSNSTLIYCQANAGNISDRCWMARKLGSDLKCNVLLLSYRGYGLSEGKPSEIGLKLDIEAAVDYINSRNEIPFFFGQSLGGAVAIHGALYAQKNQIKATCLIIENTFTSIVDLVPHVMPLLKYFAFFALKSGSV